MQTTEELLAQMEAEAQSETPVCIIDPDTRTITVPPEYQLLGVENDKRVERIPFICPKIVGDNKDLSQDFILFINYVNAKGDPNAYKINDMQVESDNITFSWLLGENVTLYQGNIQISFCGIIPGDEQDDPDKNRWGTTINTDCTVLTGLKCTQQVAENNPDALVQIWAAIDELKAGGGGSGTPGKDGREVELQNSGTAIQWRYVGDESWTDLVQLSEITGTKGDPGDNGITPHIGENGNWYLGDEDTGKPSRGEKGMSVGDVPSYVRTSAESVAKTVLQHQSNNSFCFCFLSDMHCGYKHYWDESYVVDDTAVENAGQAVKVISEICPIDVVIFGGDYSDGSWESSHPLAISQIDESMKLTDIGKGMCPLYCKGNHDDAPYMSTVNRLSITELFVRIGRRNLISNSVIDNENRSCYGYVDYESRKMRIIYLDTDDKPRWGSIQVGSGETNNYLDSCNITGEQLKWLANIALDLSEKSNPSDWGIVVVSHRSLNSETSTYFDPDSSSNKTANVQNAITVLTAYITKDSGNINHNGITVNYDFTEISSAAKIYCCVHGHDHAYTYNTLGTKSIPNIGCPNVLDGRERISDDGTTYTKTAGSSNCTAFCIITIDRANNKIYADHFGAGYDRSWNWDDPTNTSYTNLLPIATDTDNTIYNSIGYKEGYRLDSSGSELEYSGFTVTGFIPCSLNDIIRLKNITIQPSSSNASNQRISFYDSSKLYIGQTNAKVAMNDLSAMVDESGNIIQFTVKNFSSNNLTNVAYVRLNGTYIGADSIITVNEEIG